MDIRYFVGIDISKNTLDWAVFEAKNIVLQINTPNSVTGIKTALRLLKKLPDWNPSQAVFCMEHTARRTVGIYKAHLLDFLHRLQFPIWLEGSLQIKRAGGLQRGKTARRPGDTIDAQRIAEYACRFKDRMRLWQPPRPVIQQLAFLSATRQRLIQPGRRAVYNQLANPLTEQRSFVNPTLQKQLQKSCKASLATLERDRKAIDKAIDDLIAGDEHLRVLFGLITSVPGVGVATATEPGRRAVLIATNEMKTVTDPKKMACHAGVAPFDGVARAI